MFAIIDNDFIAKLTRIGLLDGFATSLKRRGVVPQLQPNIDATFDLQKRRGINKLSTEGQREELAAFAVKAERVSTDDCSKRLIDDCHLVEGIDAGDAVWLAVGACNAESVVYTGDKNAMRAVANAAACEGIRNRLQGRVCCLEQYVLDQFEDIGYAVVRRGVVADPDADQALAHAIPSISTPRGEAEMALEGYIERLRAKTGVLLRG